MNTKGLDRICLIVIVLITVGGVYGVLSWGFKQQKLLRQERQVLSEKLKDLNIAETNLQHLKGVLGATRRELEILNDRIPSTAKIGEFLKQVDMLIKKRKVDLISLQPQSTVEEKHCNRIPVRLMFKGGFTNVYQLLCDLETMHRTVLIQKLRITKTNFEPVCQVDLTASIFERT